VIPRPLWVERIERAWKRASIVWLSGVRRVGKTTLARSLPSARYLNCDLPRTTELLRDPEFFFASVDEPIVVLDEVHQLPDPSRLLKVAADAFPKLKVLATGSSTLAATSKFRDALTGRKREVHLLPVLAEETPSFGVADMRQRLLRGGLPQALLAPARDEEFFGEWLDSFFARDIQELFRIGRRSGFLLLLETLLRQSGGLIEVTSLARASGLSRPTILNYLNVLEVTHAVRVLRPYHAGGRREILQQPKAYGFDTGFVAFARGWTELRADDCGLLWEHLVLDTLQSLPEVRRTHFWRDKQQREVDFVLPRGRGACDAIECEWSSASFDPRGLLAFRASYPNGQNFLVTPLAGEGATRRVAGLEIRSTDTAGLRRALA